MVEYQIKSVNRCRFLALLLAFGSFYNGYCTGIFNPLAKPLLTRVFGFDEKLDEKKIDNYKGAFNAAFSLGAMIGVFGTGSLANKMGRKTILYLSEFVAICNALLYVVEDLRTIIGARFISGIISGMSSIGFVIISELLPNSLSGFGNASGYVCGTGGMLVAYATQNVLSEDLMVEYWRELLMVTVLTSGVRLLFLPCYLHTDTPKYVFQKCTGDDEVYSKILNCYSYIYQREHLNQATYESIRTFTAQKEASQNKVGLASLWTKQLRLRTFSGCYLAFAQQVCGINFFIFYSTAIFDEASNNGKTMTLVIGLSNFLGGFVAMALIGRKGRKFNFVWGSLIQSVCLFLLVLGTKLKFFPLLAAAACGYIIAFAAGLGGSYSAYLCEILPPVGVGVAMTVQWVLTAMIGQFTPSVSTWLGESTVLLFFAVVCFVLFATLSKWTIETKGKKEQQIVDQFEAGRLRWFDFK